jgi:hypothetical protein
LSVKEEEEEDTVRQPEIEFQGKKRGLSPGVVLEFSS